HGRRPQGIGIAQADQTLAEGAVAELVMVLQEQYEGARRKVRAGFATRFAAAILLALVDETFAEETCQLVGGVLAVVGVIALVFTGEQGVQHVVAIVVPLRGEALFEQAGSVVFVLQDEMHVTVWSGF